MVDGVEQMELGEFYAAYRNDGWGAAAYDPAMMVAVLLYAYCQGLRGSRRIAIPGGSVRQRFPKKTETPEKATPCP